MFTSKVHVLKQNTAAYFHQGTLKFPISLWQWREELPSAHFRCMGSVLLYINDSNREGRLEIEDIFLEILRESVPLKLYVSASPRHLLVTSKKKKKHKKLKLFLSQKHPS